MEHLQPKSFFAFLSHHKGSCSCAARLLKTVLCQTTKRKIFFDADNLDNTGDLFNAVQCSERLVFMLSDETLLRPWCLGELTIADQNDMEVLPLSLSMGKGVERFAALSPTELMGVELY